jgi:hypothetical protein
MCTRSCIIWVARSVQNSEVGMRPSGTGSPHHLFSCSMPEDVLRMQPEATLQFSPCEQALYSSARACGIMIGMSTCLEFHRGLPHWTSDATRMKSLAQFGCGAGAKPHVLAKTLATCANTNIINNPSYSRNCTQRLCVLVVQPIMQDEQDEQQVPKTEHAYGFQTKEFMSKQLFEACVATDRRYLPSLLWSILCTRLVPKRAVRAYQLRFEVDTT